eukprot:TRINITY_DN99746_c0_g1_i1.p1 TRINITY_DN99746_c0_g1~~TRINITY_DN99746_c0_g1_i1.p1  ORF type:complete len:228 (-),score=8.45 TRINITY_DN99746_c0_g1_i1:186-869(-)
MIEASKGERGFFTKQKNINLLFEITVASKERIKLKDFAVGLVLKLYQCVLNTISQKLSARHVRPSIKGGRFQKFTARYIRPSKEGRFQKFIKVLTLDKIPTFSKTLPKKFSACATKFQSNQQFSFAFSSYAMSYYEPVGEDRNAMHIERRICGQFQRIYFFQKLKKKGTPLGYCRQPSLFYRKDPQKETYQWFWHLYIIRIYPFILDIPQNSQLQVLKQSIILKTLK